MNSESTEKEKKVSSQSNIPKEYDILDEVKVSVSALLGSNKMIIRELLSIKKDSIIQLDRLAGDTADILVNGIPIAKGEIIMIGQSFGVRITEFISVKK